MFEHVLVKVSSLQINNDSLLKLNEKQSIEITKLKSGIEELIGIAK